MINTTTHPQLDPKYITYFNIIDLLIHIISNYLTRNNITHTISYDSDGNHCDYHIITISNYRFIIITDTRHINNPKFYIDNKTS